ncbi:MAG: LPS export ABC transporter periplasmic protein LptC [Magnetococcales bacterium]|nr:LPS export ABC transporter periplasmic protein LptC [Magnetococcales bacterium]
MMGRTIKHLLLAIALGVAGTLAWLLGGAALERPLATVPLSETGVTPEATGIRLVQFDGQQQKWSLTAEGAQRLEQEGRTMAFKPRLAIHRKDSGPIHLTANRGMIEDATRRMVFFGDVLVEDVLKRRLITQRLHFDPAKQVLSTDGAFRLTMDRITLSGIGLEIHPRTRHLKVRQKVRAVFLEGLQDLV